MRKFLVYAGMSLGGLAFLLGVGLLLIAHTDLLVYQFPASEPASIYIAADAPSPQRMAAEKPADSLLVMTWNIKFAGGRIDFFFDCFGDRVVMDSTEVLRHLKGLAAKINQVGPDLLLLQEVDVDAHRSAGINQLQWLLDHTDLHYGAYASQWKVAWIPSRGLGHVNSGNALLSRYPITEAVRRALPLMSSQDPLTRFFYLRRNILHTRLLLPQGPLTVLNTHLTAYDKDGTRRRQLELLAEEAFMAAGQGPLILGGDFNTLPPGTQQVKDFDDSVCEDEAFVMNDYSAERDYLRPFYQYFSEAIPLEQYQARESKYYSHTVDGRGFWNRRLDYLFTNRSWRRGLVHQDTSTGGMATMPLSDHAPVTALWLPEPLSTGQADTLEHVEEIRP